MSVYNHFSDCPTDYLDIELITNGPVIIVNRYNQVNSTNVDSEDIYRANYWHLVVQRSE